MSTLELTRVDVTTTGNMSGTFTVCTVSIRDSVLRATGGATSMFSLTGEISGIDGASANRGSDVTVTGSTFAGGDKVFSIAEYSAVHISDSVFYGEGSYGPYFAATPQVLQTSSITFSTFFNAPLTCGTYGFLTSSNNIYYINRAGPPVDTVTGTACSHRYDLISPQANPPSGPGNQVNVDPKFVNSSANNFHLLATSPAIDAADPGATDATDFDGIARPQGAGRDLGAFEYKP